MTTNNTFSENFVYATIISTDSYLPGVIKLHNSLKAVDSKYPFVCICSMNVSQSTINKLSTHGIKYIKLDRCAIRDASSLNFTKEFEHWKYTFDKLLLFGLTQYKKIVYLDSDMIVIENIDELFEYKSFSAVAAGNLIHPDWNRLNSGTLVIEPNINTMNKMLNLITEVYNKRQAEGLMTGDQDVINEYKSDWPTAKELILPEAYNVFFNHLNIYHNKFGFKYNNKIQHKSVKIIHFVGKNKPWNNNLIKVVLLLTKYLITFDYRLKAYIKYLKL